MSFGDWYAFAYVGSLIVVVLSWAVFRLLSMTKIEKAIMAEGKPRPCPWDGVGGRVVWYAYTVALPAKVFNELDDRMLNTADVKRYTTKADRVRAWILMVSGHAMLALGIAAWIFDIG